jgi:hypothetical protein
MKLIALNWGFVMSLMVPLELGHAQTTAPADTVRHIKVSAGTPIADLVRPGKVASCCTRAGRPH